MNNSLLQSDSELFTHLQNEEIRQRQQLQMIPSENYVSKSVLNVVGSILMNKYSEGQPNKRYYQGNANIDQIELLAKQRALSLFKLDTQEWDVNVQAVTGSIANLAVLSALLEPGDRILSMYLYDGGHLSHGWQLQDGKKVSFSSKIFDVHYYRVDPKTEKFNYDDVEKVATEIKPKLIITGGTAYPSEIDYGKMRQISNQVGAFYLADVAHEAGLIAAGVNKSPFEDADIVTMTTRKTLRGPIGALIFSRREDNQTYHSKIGLNSKIDKAVFPGLQGGPMNHSIAGIAACLFEASQSSFTQYAKQILVNAKRLAEKLGNYGFRIVSGGTEKHLVLIDLSNKNCKGKNFALALEKVNIVVNANTHPREQGSPFNPTGLRLGTPAITSRGMKENDMDQIADWINQVMDLIKDAPENFEELKAFLNQPNDELNRIASEVKSFALQFPVPGLDD